MKNKIKNILLILLLSIIPIKKWRKKLKIMRILCFVERKYPNSIFFVTPQAGIGEFTQSICLLKNLKQMISKNIVILTNRNTEKQICELYNDVVDCFFCDNLKLASEDELPVNLLEQRIYPLYKLPQSKDIKRDNDMDFRRDFFHLPKNSPIYKITPSRPQNTNKNFEKLEMLMKNYKVVFIFPDANTFDSSVLTTNDWIQIAQELEKLGYKCIFNSSNKYANYETCFLSIKETIYLASLAKKIIAFRSGISELLAITTKCKMLLLYPNGTTHFFSQKLNISIKDYEERFKKGPFLADNRYSPTINCFMITSIAKNFDRPDCKDFYYDFNIEKLLKFITDEL